MNLKTLKITRLVAALSAVAFLTACVHTTPNPIPVAQAGDDIMSCRSIENEMADMQAQQAASDSKGNGQVAKNVGLGVAGAFLLVPLFFMDTSDAHSVEARAAQARYKRLNGLYMDKGCIPAGKNAAAASSPGVAPSDDGAIVHKTIRLDGAASD
ncbi:MAG TPA: hypothetical protein VNQ97_08580 [Burkholderiaceae bacterium]|nr:hypothetical protein [Burkholderiaceae bacterium]